MLGGGEEPGVGRVRDMVSSDLLQRVVCHECLGDAGCGNIDRSADAREKLYRRYGPTGVSIILIRD